MERQKLYAEVLRLSSSERGDLAAKLIRSLDDDDEELTPEEWEALWSQEIDRRLADLRFGKVKAVPADEVFAQARRSLKSRRK